MTLLKRYYLLLLALVVTGFSACTDQWEEHNELRETVLGENVLQQIQANPNLSKFHELLVSTGYAEVVQGSKTYTVWAPSDQALAGVDQALLNDPVKLKAFVANHISNQRYLAGQPSQRVKMLSGKYLIWEADKLDGAAIETATANRYAGNGVVHVLQTALLPRQNIWEYVQSSTLASRQAAFLNSLNFTFFNPNTAEVDHIDPATGEPVFKPGTGFSTRNRFFERVHNIANEDSLYTFILLTDGAFDTELNELKPYFNSPVNADSIASFHLVKDLAFRGLILPENLPDTLLSATNVKVPIDKNAIVQTIRTSNGIVYVMNKVDFALKYKLPTFLIEGENATGFSRNDIDIRIHRRYREWASNLLDIRVREHGTARLHIWYQVNGMYSTKYKVYWRAVNDFTTENFQQRLAIGLPDAENFPYREVGLNNFDEVLLGEITISEYGAQDFYLVGANSTNNALNPLVLDYLKLVPVL
jgi:uncharacterized surface protein with fasciclin (FAS1) repeats